MDGRSQRQILHVELRAGHGLVRENKVSVMTFGIYGNIEKYEMWRGTGSSTLNFRRLRHIEEKVSCKI